jgi:hypothetical protein
MCVLFDDFAIIGCRPQVHNAWHQLKSYVIDRDLYVSMVTFYYFNVPSQVFIYSQYGQNSS